MSSLPLTWSCHHHEHVSNYERRDTDAYLDDRAYKRLVPRELVFLVARLFLFNASLKILVCRSLCPRSNLVSARKDKIIHWCTSTHSVNPHAQVKERIDGVHLRPRQSCVLVQPPSVLIGDTFSILDVQRDDADLVGVTVHRVIRGA